MFLFCRIDRWKQSEKTGEREIAMWLCMLDYRTGQASRAIEKNCIKKLHLLIVFIPSHRQGSNIQLSCVKLRLWLSLIVEGGTLIYF